MKNLYLLLYLFLISNLTFGQKYFNNGAGNHLWSDAGNWSNGKPNALNAVVVIKSDKVIIDENVTIGWLKKGKITGTKYNTVITNCNNEAACNANDKILTFSGKGTGGNTLSVINLEVGKDLKFDSHIKVLVEGNDTFEGFKINEAGTASITFGANSTLELEQNIKITNHIGTRRFHFNGAVTGTGKIQIGGGGTNTEFGSTYNGANQNGIEIIGNNVAIVSNVADNGTFLAASKSITYSSNTTGGALTINGENTLKGNIVTTNNAATLTVAKNQSGAGTITMGAGDLNLTVGNNVNNLNFADCSGATWGANLVITGFTSGVLGFGQDANGLTNAQLAKVNIGGATPTLNASGKLIVALPSITLSVSSATIAETNTTASTITATMSAADGSNNTTVTIGAKNTSTATVTDDYTFSSTTITIPSGQTTGTATITAVDDNVDDDNETVIVEITNVSNNALESGTQEQTITIEDNDTGPVTASTFNNAGGNFLWSNGANWSAGVPNVASAVATLTASPKLDVDVEIKQLKLGGGSGDVTVTQANANAPKTLTINGTGVTQPIQTNRANTDLLLDVKVNFSSTDSEAYNINNGLTSTVTFGSNSELTLANGGTAKFIGANNRKWIFNGIIKGGGTIVIGGNAKADFGTTSNHANYGGNIKLLQNAVVNINTADNGTFLIDGKTLSMDATATNGATVTINGENVFKGNIDTGAKDLTLNVNKKQSNIGLITMGAGNLTIGLGANVTELLFANHSNATWGAGNLTISGFRDNIVGFGENANGLTNAQLGKILIGNNQTPQVAIGANGRLTAAAPPVVSVSTFTNAAGDALWSNAANWSAGIPNVNTAKVTVSAPLTIDTDVEIAQIKLGGTLPVNTAAIAIQTLNNKTLTLNGNGVTQIVQNNKSSVDLNFMLKVIVTSSDEEIMIVNGSGSSSIGFGQASELTLNAPTKFIAKVGGQSSIQMHGALKGSGAFIVGDKTEVKFNQSADNSTFTGGFKLSGSDAKIISNITKTVNNSSGIFLKSGVSIQPDIAANGSVTVNGKNSYNGNVMVQRNKDFTLRFNADQADAGLIDLDSGKLKLFMNANVDTLAFDDASQVSWGSGKLEINGLIDNVIRFGINANGLTPTQLSQIDIGGGNTVIIDSLGRISGKLVTQSTFTNAGGDHLWSNKANWSNGIPNVPTASVIIKDSLILDKNVDIAQIKLSQATKNVAVTSVGDSILTLNGKGVMAVVQNNSQDRNFVFDLSVIFSSDSAKHVQANATSTKITFGPNSDLKLSSGTIFSAAGSGRDIVMQGILRGSGGLKVSTNSAVTFDTSSNNANYTGSLELDGQSSRIIAKSSSTLVDTGKKVLVTGLSTRLDLDSENVIKGNIENGAYGMVKIFINKKQESFGTFKIGSSDSEIVLDTALYSTNNTLVSFADHSNVTWGLGKLIVKGFKDKSLRFGTNASGLPQNLLDKVFVGGGKVVIDSLGYLHRDQDGDGVRDTEDQCPNTPPGEQVDANGPNAGCSDSQKDSDGDGVSDDKDKCPGTPAGEIVDADGCPIPLFVEKLTFVENIYPNPAKDHLKVILKDNSKVKDIHFVGLSGKISKPRNFNQYNRTLNINISNLNDGIYLMNVNTEKGSNRVKIVIKK